MTGPKRFREVFPGGEKAAGHARRVIAGWLADAVPAQSLGDLQLLVTEVVANCVRHGRVGEDGRIDLRINVNGLAVRVEVRDTGIQVDPEVRQPDLSGGGGFGMVLVERMSRTWGVEHEPGVVMWFELDLDSAGAAGSAGRAMGLQRRAHVPRTRTLRRCGPQARVSGPLMLRAR